MESKYLVLEAVEFSTYRLSTTKDGRIVTPNARIYLEPGIEFERVTFMWGSNSIDKLTFTNIPLSESDSIPHRRSIYIDFNFEVGGLRYEHKLVDLEKRIETIDQILK